MKRNILYIEDDQLLQEEQVEYFERRGYNVTSAFDGEEALKKIKENKYDILILDLVMEKMDGEEFLIKILKQINDIPPIVVISAYFKEETVNFCLNAGAICLFKKPYERDDLVKAIKSIIEKDDDALISLANDLSNGIEAVSSPKNIIYKLSHDLKEIVEKRDPVGHMVMKREAALKAHFKEVSKNNYDYENIDEPILLIARRWNSWYPSFFDVPGGCYAIIKNDKHRGDVNVTIIDPGFKCLEVLKGLGVSVADIDTCIVTHNHPDHIGGIFEYMSARYALDLKTKAWCNKATTDMLGDCSGFNMEMKELEKEIETPLFKYNKGYNSERKLNVIGFSTSHREIGKSSSTIGLSISIFNSKNAGDNLFSKAVILGDTEYRRPHNNKFIDYLTAETVKFIVLHVGSTQMKQREGGHLYYPGLKKILTDIEVALENKGRTSYKMPVLLSEWGLEHATKEQIDRICDTDISGFDDRSPIIEIMNNLNDEYECLSILPADIGLKIGLETGKIYIDDMQVDVDDVDVNMTEDGILYTC